MFNLESFLTAFRPWDVLDILIVSVVLYNLYMLIYDTRAASLVKGLVVLVLATLVSSWFELHVINWLLQKSMTVLLVALPVVFQPELRKGLERLGRGRFFSKSRFDEAEVDKLLNALVTAVLNMAKHKIGALIVIERDTGLNEYIETGTAIDALVSTEILINIFIPNTPLHDGAVIIRGDRIAAAACFLPLTDARDLSKELGTRHRAAIGLSEVSDALILVVSEETGTLSLAASGYLRRDLTGDDMKTALRPVFLTDNNNGNAILSAIKNWRQRK